MMFLKSLIVVLLLGAYSMSPDDEVFSWSDTHKLSWNYFKAAPKPNLSVVAVTASGITFEFSLIETENGVVGFDAKVLAHFYPNKSWYIKDEVDDHVLLHEQLHFDITEIYARIFRKELAQIKVNSNIKSELRALHKKINGALAMTQNKYDRESDNSINMEYQARWNLYVKQELAKLEAYKSKD